MQENRAFANPNCKNIMETKKSKDVVWKKESYHNRTEKYAKKIKY